MLEQADIKQITEIIRQELADTQAIDKFLFKKNIQIFNGRNIQTGRDIGTKIGTATDQKISFHNADPVIQASHISNPSGGATTDTQARTAIDAILVILENKGFNAKS